MISKRKKKKLKKREKKKWKDLENVKGLDESDIGDKKQSRRESSEVVSFLREKLEQNLEQWKRSSGKTA